MPDFRDSIHLLKKKFFDKGLSEKDLVVLTGTLSLSSLNMNCVCVYKYINHADSMGLFSW